MPEQRSVTDKGGTMRLGEYPCRPLGNTLTMQAYQNNEVVERHRHRFELNNTYREMLESSGMIIGGVSPDNRLVETAEVRDHPFMIGVQFHPEFKSRPNRAHPLFCTFIDAANQVIREGGQRPLPMNSAN
jgi:CTP synthase